MTNTPSPPKVSIGMPVYNGEAFLRQALDSILAQTYPHFELIISDNASTDATPDICKEYASKDARIRYIRQSSNIGATANFRFVLREARHERFIWAAADDWWDVDRLEKLVCALTDEDAAVVGTIKRYIDSQPFAEYTPIAFRRGAWWRYLMREESRCDKTYFVYGLVHRDIAQRLFRDELVSGYGGDAIFNYGLLWHGNLKSIPGATLHCTAHRQSTGSLQAEGYRWSWVRLVFMAHPWSYYAHYWRMTPQPYRFWLAPALVAKAIASQIHLWWRAFRRLVLGRPFVHGALPHGERRVFDAGL